MAGLEGLGFSGGCLEGVWMVVALCVGYGVVLGRVNGEESIVKL